MASHAAAATEQSAPRVRNEKPGSKSHKAKAIPVLIAGSLGGFLLPIMSGALPDLTGIRTSLVMLMHGVVRVSPIRMYWAEVRQAEVIGPRSTAFGLKG